MGGFGIPHGREDVVNVAAIPKKRRPGVNWMPARRKLYRFTENTIEVIAPWPHPMAWCFQDGQWRGHYPRVRFEHLLDGAVVPFPKMFERPAWETVPEAVRARVLECSLADRQWQTLLLLARCPGALRLCEEIPLLAAAAANLGSICHQQQRTIPTKPWRAVATALSHPKSKTCWQKVSRLLGWPNDPSFYRVLRAAGPLGRDEWSGFDLAALPWLWQDDETRKMLQHGPALTGARMAWMSSVANYYQLGGRLLPRFVMEDVSDDQLRTRAGVLSSLRTALQYSQGMEAPAAASLTSVEGMEAAIAAMTQDPFGVGPFPPPPIAGSADILPLTLVEELKEEGRLMSHCIGWNGYDRRCRGRRGYAYSIRQGPHSSRCATLWIEPSEIAPGLFAVGQIQGPHNTAVPKNIQQRVDAWLAEANRKVSERWSKQQSVDDLLPHPWAPTPGTTVREWIRNLWDIRPAPGMVVPQEAPFPRPDVPYQPFDWDEDIPF